MIKQYDKVLLKTGDTAYIVDILEEDIAFIADIDKDGDTYTETIYIEDIKTILSN